MKLGIFAESSGREGLPRERGCTGWLLGQSWKEHAHRGLITGCGWNFSSFPCRRESRASWLKQHVFQDKGETKLTVPFRVDVYIYLRAASVWFLSTQFSQCSHSELSPAQAPIIRKLPTVGGCDRPAAPQSVQWGGVTGSRSKILQAFLLG